MQLVNTHTIGELVSVRKIEVDGFEDGKWIEGIPMIELQVQSQSLDLEGQLNFSIDKVQLESKLYGNYSDKVGQVVGIPYCMETTKKGQKYYYDESMPILIFKDKLTNLLKADSSKK